MRRACAVSAGLVVGILVWLLPARTAREEPPAPAPVVSQRPIGVAG